ncbi:MAG: DUF3379 family protein [Wenzhouxiangellaceae bacterium]
MNLLEFKRQLMTAPRERTGEMRQARAQGGEFALAAAESDRFESVLDRALQVPAPHALADSIILEQSLSAQSSSTGGLSPRWPQISAIAASLTLAVALVTFLVVGRQGGDGIDIQAYLAGHWAHDGPQVVAASDAQPSSLDRIEYVFSELGVQLSPELMQRVRVSKFCPTPDGAGAHVVLATDQGPVTMYYMPRTRIPGAPSNFSFNGNMDATVINLERGSLALVAESGVKTPELVREISRQLSFVPQTTI